MANTLIRFSFISSIALVLLVHSSCIKDPIGEPPPVPESGVFIVCEGNFNWGNASITSYDEKNNLTTQNYFELVNNFSLGDVAQSIFETEENYYIVVNNSGKIEVVKKDGFSSEFTINGFDSPRYFQAVNDSIAYVSDLYANKITVINYKSGAIQSDIPVNGWSEQMAKVEDSVYVSLYSAKSIAIINALNHSLLAEIALALSPTIIRKDKNNKLWVLASEYEGSSILYKIDLADRQIEDEWEFEAENPIIQIDLPENGNDIYILRSGGEIYKFPILGSEIIIPLFTASIDNAYGLKISDEGDIFICEAFDFIQNGSVKKYNESGVLLKTIESGISPNSIIFR